MTSHRCFVGATPCGCPKQVQGPAPTGFYDLLAEVSMTCLSSLVSL